MPTYVSNATDKTRDFITHSAGGPIDPLINTGLAALEQRPEQAQPTLVRVRDFRG